MKILKTTICGTDLHIMKGDLPEVKDGRILGKPVRKVKGDKVIAGSINGNGSFQLAVSHGSTDSYLAHTAAVDHF